MTGMDGLIWGLELWKLALGTLAGTSTAVVGIILWLGKRVRAISADAAQEAMAPHSDTMRRVAAVEKDVAAVRHDVKNLRQEHMGLGERLHRMDGAMQRLAGKEDLAQFARDFSEFRGRTDAELRSVGGMVHSIHEAILRSGKGAD